MVKNFIILHGLSKNNLRALGFVLALAYFFTAGIFSLPIVELDKSLVILAKRSLLCFVLIVFGLCIDWRKQNAQRCVIFSFLWIAVLLLNYIFHGEASRIFFRISQALCVLIIVCFFMQNFRQIKEVIKFCTPISIFLLFINIAVLALSFVDLSFVKNIASGFGGNRVNYSIWLSEINLLILILWHSRTDINYHSKKIENIIILAAIFSIFALQIASGGRIGILLSALSLCYISYLKMGFTTAFVVQKIVLFLFFSLSSRLSPTIMRDWPGSQQINTDILRGLDTSKITLRDSENFHGVFSELFNYFDRLSSFRISIDISAIKSIDLETFLIGRGVGKFIVLDPKGDEQQVHNFFLNILGEFGLASVILISIVIFYPLLKKSKQNLQILKFSILVWLIPANLQPEFYINNVSSSLIHWGCYGVFLHFINFKNSPKKTI